MCATSSLICPCYSSQGSQWCSSCCNSAFSRHCPTASSHPPIPCSTTTHLSSLTPSHPSPSSPSSWCPFHISTLICSTSTWSSSFQCCRRRRAWRGRSGSWRWARGFGSPLSSLCSKNPSLNRLESCSGLCSSSSSRRVPYYRPNPWSIPQHSSRSGRGCKRWQPSGEFVISPR